MRKPLVPQRTEPSPGSGPSEAWNLLRTTGQAVIVVLFACVTASAQTGKCPSNVALTEAKVSALVAGAEDRAIELIRSCHVDFVLHPETRARLQKAGATPNVLDVLEQESFGHMTLAEAHREVDEYLEPEMQKIRDSSDARRKEQLDQSERAYQTARQPVLDSLKAQKGPLDTTADYQARLSRARDNLDQMDRRHRDEQESIRKRFDDEARTQSQPLLNLAANLKSRKYRVAGASLQIESYDADRGVLIASTDASKYKFSVRSDTMKKIAVANGTTLSMRDEVSLMQPFQDDQSRIRYIQAPALIGEMQIAGYPWQPEPEPAPVPKLDTRKAPPAPVVPPPPPAPKYTGPASGSLACEGQVATSGADLMLPTPLPEGLGPMNVEIANPDPLSWARTRLSLRDKRYYVVLVGYKKPGTNNHPNCSVRWNLKP